MTSHVAQLPVTVFLVPVSLHTLKPQIDNINDDHLRRGVHSQQCLTPALFRACKPAARRHPWLRLRFTDACNLLWPLSRFARLEHDGRQMAMYPTTRLSVLAIPTLGSPVAVRQLHYPIDLRYAELNVKQL